MSFFCLLWMPLFYLFRRSITAESSSGGVWALLLGSITAVIQFFLGNIVSPGGFGLSRWLYGFFEIVSLPVLIPFIICLFFIIFRWLPAETDFADFILLWLIPVSAMQALSWSSYNDPMLLIAVPLLWTAQASGISLFINWIIKKRRWYIIIFSILFILILPLAASSSYWAFFSHQLFRGFMLFSVTMIPLVLSIILRIAKK